MSVWNERYAGEAYFYGTEPNAFLVSQKPLLKAGMSCLAVADGEGRNGVWLAEQGLDVLSLDASPVAQAKAKRLAQTRGVAMRFEQADLLSWRSDERFDLIAAIFIQFVGPELRPAQFENLKRHLKPGGLLLLQGYTLRQLEYKTGGPSQAENLYSEAMLRGLCADMEMLHLREHDSVIREGAGHSGQSALIDLVARAN
jgi:cyclopropane fatty-acyl-phospholipid synthase-like methyltransferase